MADLFINAGTGAVSFPQADLFTGGARMIFRKADLFINASGARTVFPEAVSSINAGAGARRSFPKADLFIYATGARTVFSKDLPLPTWGYGYKWELSESPT